MGGYSYERSDMARQKKTQRIINKAIEVLTEYRPMTVRQVYYRLVATEVVENTRGRYKAVVGALRDARKEGSIPWHWIEDRLRRPRKVSMWEDVSHYAYDARRWYRRNVWATQPRLVEAWLEKDALSGIFEDVLRPYGITLNVGRGYDGWTSVHDAAQRYLAFGNKATILYFGDFDPSGRDMVRSLVERIGFFGSRPDMEICAILRSDIDDYDLPPAFTKITDTRRGTFVAEHGDISVELDALPIEILRRRIQDSVTDRMDLDALSRTKEQEEHDQEEIEELLRGA